MESYDDDEEEYEVDEYAGSGNGHGDYASSVEAEISGDWRPRVVVQCFFFSKLFSGEKYGKINLRKAPSKRLIF